MASRSGSFTEATSLARISGDKAHFSLSFRRLSTRLWCLLTPQGRSYLRMCLLSHREVVVGRAGDGYSTEYVAALHRWIGRVGGRRELQEYLSSTG